MGRSPTLVPQYRQVPNGGWLQISSQFLMLRKGRSPCSSCTGCLQKKQNRKQTSPENKSAQKTSDKFLETLNTTKQLQIRRNKGVCPSSYHQGTRRTLMNHQRKLEIQFCGQTASWTQNERGGPAGASTGDSVMSDALTGSSPQVLQGPAHQLELQGPETSADLLLIFSQQVTHTAWGHILSHDLQAQIRENPVTQPGASQEGPPSQQGVPLWAEQHRGQELLVQWLHCRDLGAQASHCNPPNRSRYTVAI